MGVKEWNDRVEIGGKFPPEAGRYHLYVSWACPFSHRVTVMRKLKGLEDVISISLLHWDKGEPEPKTGKPPGWHFLTPEQDPVCIADPVYGAEYLSEVYIKVQPDYKGPWSVPVLFDKKTHQIVNNQSHELMNMLSTAFDSVGPENRKGFTYYPKAFAKQIDEYASRVQKDIALGSYYAGYAETQADYDKFSSDCFAALDFFEDMIEKSGGPWLFGKDLTELDVRLYSPLVRFDVVYAVHFKCNDRLIRSGYKNLGLYLKRLYSFAPFYSTTNFDHIKKTYYCTQKQVNPFGIVPRGPLPPVEALAAGDHAGSIEGTYEA